MTTATVADPVQLAKVRERDRWAARSWLWSNSSIRALRGCGRIVRDREAGVQVSVTIGADGQRHAGFKNTLRCGNPHCCPVDSATILAKRARLVSEVIWRHRHDIHDEETAAAARKRGWNAPYGGPVVAFLTLTTGHRRSDRLVSILDAEAKGLAKVFGGAWKRDQELYGVEMAGRGGKVAPRIGWVRVLDTTVGPAVNGWHPHAHILLFLRAGVTDAEIQDLGEQMWSRWDRGIRAAGGPGGDLEHGMEIHRVTGGGDAELGEYFAKASYELVNTTAKAGRGDGHFSPMQLLASIMRHRSGMSCEAPDDHAPDCECCILAPAELALRVRLWHEWEQAVAGRRQISISSGLLPYLGLGSDWEPDDDRDSDDTTELADNAAIMSITVPTELYEWAARTGRLPAFKEAICEGGWAARSALDQLQIDYGREMIRLAAEMLGRAGVELVVDDDVGLVGVAAGSGRVLDHFALDRSGREGVFGGLVDRLDVVFERRRETSAQARPELSSAVRSATTGCVVGRFDVEPVWLRRAAEPAAVRARYGV